MLPPLCGEQANMPSFTLLQISVSRSQSPLSSWLQTYGEDSFRGNFISPNNFVTDTNSGTHYSEALCAAQEGNMTLRMFLPIFVVYYLRDLIHTPQMSTKTPLWEYGKRLNMQSPQYGHQTRKRCMQHSRMSIFYCTLAATGECKVLW